MIDLELYRNRLNLQGATFLQIDHEDAIVALGSAQNSDYKAR